MTDSRTVILGGGFGGLAEAQGHVVASQIVSSILGLAASEVFDGQGFCYLETGGGEAVKAEGSFFAVPHPVMQTRTPDRAQLQDKLQWVAQHLESIRKPSKSPAKGGSSAGFRIDSWYSPGDH